MLNDMVNEANTEATGITNIPAADIIALIAILLTHSHSLFVTISRIDTVARDFMRLISRGKHIYILT